MQESNAGAVATNLIKERKAALEILEEAKADVKRIDGLLADIIKPEQILKAVNKTSGETTHTDLGCVFKVEASKTVKWDTALLQKLAQKCKTWEQVASIFKIKFEIPEAKYTFLKESIAAGTFTLFSLAELDAARTVEIGEAKIKSAEILST